MGLTLEGLPDLSGRVAIITGANTGIGKVMALEMARRRATVIIGASRGRKGGHMGWNGYGDGRPSGCCYSGAIP
jgi:NAD(P)-dependent dehydrogenase (short-subunit alcohol dehydrogenase family)